MALRVHNPAGGSYVSASRPFVGASGSTAGRAGLVPGPAAGQNNQVLFGSGTFGVMTASNIYCADTCNICGDGIGEVVTLQRLMNAIASKLQARTVFNYNGPTEESGSGSGSGSESSSETFQREYVVDTYGLVGNSGETVTTAQLTSALADTIQSRTVFNILEAEEPEEDPQNNEEPQQPENSEVQENTPGESDSNNTDDPVDEPVVEESQPEESNPGEDDEQSLKDMMLNME